MDDIEIDKWIDQIEANKADWSDKRTGRNKMKKIVLKKGGVQPEQPALAIHARRKHRQNSKIR